MSTALETLSAANHVEPSSPGEVAEAVRTAASSRTFIYPVGGGTSLDFGHPPSSGGTALHLGGLNRIVDYASADMTITVEVGMTIGELNETVAAHRQQVPLDVPQPATATLGGVIATNWSGPRRCGYGTLRDYLIGIAAVDGRGVPFHGGGRVVKNVAGYDFCKLLIGSLGTLGVVTEATLKLKPLPDVTRTLIAGVKSWDQAERLLAAAIDLPFVPTMLEVLAGPAWPQTPMFQSMAATEPLLAIRLEGSADEVEFMTGLLEAELAASDVAVADTLDDDDSQQILALLSEFSDSGVAASSAPLVLKLAVPPGDVIAICRKIQETTPVVSLQAHAGDGVVIARFDEFAAGDLSDVIVSQLRPAALHCGGSLIVLSSEFEGLTPQIIWGGRTPAHVMMDAIKKQFDPHGILNPGRFTYTS